MYKSCPRCLKNKPRSDFYVGESKSYSNCKSCEKDKVKNRAQQLRSRSDEEVLKDRARLRPDGLKKCSSCSGQFKLTEFGINRAAPDGLAHACKACRLKRSRKGQKKYSNTHVRKKGNRSKAEILNDRNRLRPDGVKDCRLCRMRKSFDDFYPDRYSYDGLRAECVECSHSRDKAYRGQIREMVVSQLTSIYGDLCLFPTCKETDGLEIDHVIPLSKGGPDEFGNYQLLCRFHNRSKGGTVADYRWTASRKDEREGI